MIAAANDIIDPTLPRMAPDQLRLLMAQIVGLHAHHTSTYETQEVLRNLIRALPRSPHLPGMRLADMAECIAKDYGITVEQLRGQSVKREFTRPRQAFYHTAYATGDFSYPQIGRWCGGRDHTTVRHGVAAHARRLPNLDPMGMAAE